MEKSTFSLVWFNVEPVVQTWIGVNVWILSSCYVWLSLGQFFVFSMLTVMYWRCWKGYLVKDQEENSNCIVILCKSVFKLLLKWQGCRVFLLVLSRQSLEPGWLIEREREKKKRGLSNVSCIWGFRNSVSHLFTWYLMWWHFLSYHCILMIGNHNYLV